MCIYNMLYEAGISYGEKTKPTQSCEYIGKAVYDGGLFSKKYVGNKCNSPKPCGRCGGGLCKLLVD